MSRVVRWGRWFVVVLFAVMAIEEALWYPLGSLAPDIRLGSREITYKFVMNALFSGAIASCAWGIAKWQQWSRGIAAGICAAFIVIEAFFAIGLAQGEPKLLPISLMLISVCAEVWLLLPAVRAEFSRRNQVA